MKKTLMLLATVMATMFSVMGNGNYQGGSCDSAWVWKSAHGDMTNPNYLFCQEPCPEGPDRVTGESAGTMDKLSTACATVTFGGECAGLEQDCPSMVITATE
jgi:hypothetical protein